jgi:hypothetical protein
MNIEAFLLCDAATDERGKLNVLGAFDTIFSKQMPAIHPACTVALRIRFEKVEEGEHRVRLQIIDLDGKPVSPKLEGNITVRVPDNVDSSVVNLILNIQGQKFENYGKFNIQLAIDGAKESSLPLLVSKVPDQA